MSDVTCRGSFALGTACGRCSRCRREIESYTAMKFVRDKLNTPSSAISRIEELEAKLAKAVDVIDWVLICWDDHNEHGYHMQGDWVYDARTILAELTGGKDE